jgi:hypothetical protein
MDLERAKEIGTTGGCGEVAEIIHNREESPKELRTLFKQVLKFEK